MFSRLLMAAFCANIAAAHPAVLQAEDTPKIELSGKPSWLPLGGEVYHASKRVHARTQILSFHRPPRWFGVNPAEHPVPTRLEDVPLVDHGVRLALNVKATPARSLLRFHLTLSTSDEPAFREVEHRWTNTLPFLFAFYSDGNAVSFPTPSFGKEGGVNSLQVLVAKNGEKTWNLWVNAESILDLLPDREPQDVAIIAAFGERQHDGFALMGERFGDVLATLEQKRKPHVVVRSHTILLRWTGAEWQTPEQQGAEDRHATAQESQVPVSLYDIVCKAVKVSPNPAQLGDRIYIKYSLTSAGTLGIPSNTYDVQLYVDGKLVKSDLQCPHLSNGGSYSVSTPFVADAPGRHSVKIVVDSQNHLIETDESNNVVEGEFTVQAPGE